MKSKKHLSIVVASFLIGTIFVGCGSSSSTKKATLEDAPVDGVSYSCKNKFGTNVSEGKTDNNGTFYYKDRDNECEFKVGNLELGKVKMESTLVEDRVMPADLAGEKSNTEGKALLVAQILQSFDIDANASNGIEVNPKVAKLLSDTNISIKEIDSIDEVVTIIETKAQEKHEKVHIKVVDADEAIKHLVSPVGAETILDLSQDKGDETTTNTDNETVKYPQASKQQEAENTKDSNQQEAQNLKDENQQEAQENRDSDQQEAENLKDENQQEVENLKDDEQDSKDETKGSFIDTVKDDIKDMIGLEDNNSTTDDNQDSSNSSTQEDTNSSSNQEQTSDNNSTATTQDNTNNTTSTSEDNSTNTQTSNNQDSSNSSNSTKSSDSNGSNSTNSAL